MAFMVLDRRPSRCRLWDGSTFMECACARGRRTAIRMVQALQVPARSVVLLHQVVCRPHSSICAGGIAPHLEPGIVARTITSSNKPVAVRGFWNIPHPVVHPPVDNVFPGLPARPAVRRACWVIFQMPIFVSRVLFISSDLSEDDFYALPKLILFCAK